MCSSPHWQVGQSWFREKLSPANREQRLSRWADFAKNCLPRIRSKVLPRFREKYRALGRQKMGSNMRPRYIQFRDIHDRDISGLHCIMPLYNHVYYQQNQGKNPSSVQQKPQSFSWGLLKVGHQDRSSPKWFQSAMPYSKALAELCIPVYSHWNTIFCTFPPNYFRCGKIHF